MCFDRMYSMKYDIVDQDLTNPIPPAVKSENEELVELCKNVCNTHNNLYRMNMKYNNDYCDSVTDLIIDLDLTNSIPTTFAVLKLAVNSENEELIELYKNVCKNHNNNMKNDMFPNSGFDIFVPKDIEFSDNIQSMFIDHQIKAEMNIVSIADNNIAINETGFYMYPRSSISKTPLMLSNHTGIIDSGYRGSIIGAFRYFQKGEEIYKVEKHTRLLQICHPSLCRIFVCLVNENKLSNTSRGIGGFGSTGK